MTFQDPLDITLFVQRKVLSSALPFIQRHYFKKRWIRTLQMAARAWVGFLLDYLAIGILFGVYGDHLKNWNIVWKSFIGVCISGDVILLTSFIIPLLCRNKRCPDSLKNMEDGLEQSCRCNLFIVQFVSFKCLSLLQALFVVGQSVLIDVNSLSGQENTGRIVLSVVTGVDVLTNAVELFSSGCFWCVCCIHSPEIIPDEERRRQRNITHDEESCRRQRNKYGNPSFLTTRTDAHRDGDFVFTIESNRPERVDSENNRLESNRLERIDLDALEADNSPDYQREEQPASSQTDV